MLDARWSPWPELAVCGTGPSVGRSTGSGVSAVATVRGGCCDEGDEVELKSELKLVVKAAVTQQRASNAFERWVRCPSDFSPDKPRQTTAACSARSGARVCFTQRERCWRMAIWWRQQRLGEWRCPGGQGCTAWCIWRGRGVRLGWENPEREETEGIEEMKR